MVSMLTLNIKQRQLGNSLAQRGFCQVKSGSLAHSVTNQLSPNVKIASNDDKPKRPHYHAKHVNAAVGSTATPGQRRGLPLAGVRPQLAQLFLVLFHMPIFQDFFSSTRGQKNVLKDHGPGRAQGPETLPVKMNLEERMAFRRELLFETVRSTLQSYFIEASSYRFKVMRTDKRGHCYVVMLDMSPMFMESEQGQHRQLAGIASALTKNALTRYGLVVGGIYWRTDETLAAPVADWARPSAPASLAASTSGPALSNIEKYEQVTAEELAAFEAAWQKSNDIQIGDRTYSSDLAPLGEDSPR